MNFKDRAEKKLVGFADVFSDIVNATLFSGKKVVDETELEQEIPRSEYGANGALKEQERDVVKFWKEGNVRIALYGVENQTEIDKDMPLRVIGYDGAAYTAQVHEGNKGKNGYYPVITIIVYYGDKPWDSPKCLMDCLEVKEQLKPFVNDYPLHILDLSQITREQVEMFNSDFKVIADFFYHERQGKKFEENEHEIIHVKEVMRVLKALTKDEKFDEAYAERIQKKGGSFTMTKFVTEAVNRKERETLLKSVLAIMDTLNFNFEQATETLKLNENEKNMVLDDLKERGIDL